jgi:hypothetical protein
MTTQYTTTDIDKIQARSLHLFSRATTPEMMDEKTYINWVRQWKKTHHKMVDVLKHLKAMRSKRGQATDQLALLAMQRVAQTSYTGRQCAKLSLKFGKEMEQQRDKMFEELLGAMPAEAIGQA